MKADNGKIITTVVFVCASIAFHCPFYSVHTLHAQAPVAPVTDWRATVDSATQQIVLSWRPSADSATLGYHLCTGNPCLDYDTVFGRLDTSYVCVDHSPLERHTYRLHVFDSVYNVSELTPAFGNIVLEADVPECETTVSARWTPYPGIPDGRPFYTLQTRLEPFDSTFYNQFTTGDSTALETTFSMPESVTRAWLRVVAFGNNGFRSLSNTVMVERRTVDSASVVAISDIEYDSLHTAIDLTFLVDTAFEYTLYRSVDGTPWRSVETFHPTASPYTYRDMGINPYDSLHCYQLEVLDACGLNPHYSSTACVVVPNPPVPAIAIPNVIVAGSDDNGTFQPKIQGLKGDLYELTIYNRKGLLVYSTTDPAAGWTPPDSAPQGAYSYFLRCRYNTNDIKTYAGTVTLIR
ncbi:MAG: gliding motility-associated C-terminal domain-containing protein [Bacteroidales bacterium]|nr:gliding motility-associated C-terminal domain-containing protein [Bacteroidales bacterium]